jgi:hypothetical protein
MFLQMFRFHWHAARVALLPLTIAAFALPLASIQGNFRLETTAGAEFQTTAVVTSLQGWLPFFPGLAALVGVTLAMTAWASDHGGRHVYALALPVGRGRYIVLKMVAGALLAVPPFAALWLGAGLASTAVDIPAGLDTYVVPVALRFLLASLTAYAGVFALSAWSSRGAVAVVATAAGVLLAAELGTTALAHTVAPGLSTFSPLAWVIQAAIEVPGPLGVFTGNWSMIDV